MDTVVTNLDYFFLEFMGSHIARLFCPVCNEGGLANFLPEPFWKYLKKKGSWSCDVPLFCHNLNFIEREYWATFGFKQKAQLRTHPGISDTTFFTSCFGYVFSKVGVRAIIGVTEFKAEFAGMLKLYERFEVIYLNLVLHETFASRLFCNLKVRRI